MIESAIRSNAFEELAAAAAAIRNPALEEWLAEGRPVVGHFCSHVPTEVLTAAGALPYRMRGTGSTGTELADAYFSHLNCSFVRHTFNQALRGEYDFLSGLVCVSSCDHVRRVYDNWKRQIDTPFITIMALPKKVGDPQVAWYREEIELLARAVGEHFGVEITDERLADAIRLHNRTRALQRELYALRKASRPPITGAEALAVMVAGTSMPRDRYNQLLEELIRDLKAGGEGNGDYRARLMIVGSELDDPEYVGVIESQGGLIVTDSICFGTRTMWVDVDESDDPISALARYYIQERPSCPRMNEDQPRRARFLRELIDEFSVDGVIGERMMFCDVWCAEHYMNALDFKEQGVPFLQLDREYLMSGKGQLRTRVQAFLESMGK
ncbi:MAG: 2-hydroxyacyl-CoA dehydratase [Candidatus Dadabacteria bacterium]|nr:MAG: 2-hydroxyacyl-CoA dehydratase [Candidatus Dadabacteria bacterium]